MPKIALTASVSKNGLITITDGTMTLKLSWADIPSGFVGNDSGDTVIKIREVVDCISGVTKYRQCVCSAAYSTSLGNS